MGYKPLDWSTRFDGHGRATVNLTYLHPAGDDVSPADAYNEWWKRHGSTSGGVDYDRPYTAALMADPVARGLVASLASTIKLH